MKNVVLGIDVSKKFCDVALCINNKIYTKKFDNNLNGFLELKSWLKKESATTAHICMEATGGYEALLAKFFYDNKFKVSVVNPARIKGFAMSKLSRVKTDKEDCKLIANFCEAMNPDLWKPTAQHIQNLQQLVRRLDMLIANKNQETNRLKIADKIIIPNIQSHIDFLDQQIKDIEQLIKNHITSHEDLHQKEKLLMSIPGIGNKTTAIILAFLGETEKFSSAKQIVAFVGLNPKPKQSGSSIYGSSKISKTGDAYLRQSFYMPILTAIRFNPILKELAQRLADNGKAKMVIVVAAMRKLLHIIYGVLKTQTVFNPSIVC
jgi:transposase